MKLISLDVWNTLIQSNPEYSKYRNEYLSKEFNLSINEIETIYLKIKNNSDKMAEQESHCFTNEEIFKIFLKRLKYENYNWKKLRGEIEKIFVEYPPFVLTETIKYLNNIQKRNIKLSIASNTSFIRGKILQKVLLNNWGINWEFLVFSDQVNKPKPHPQFWKTVIFEAKRYANIKPENILHIGDNKICDGSCTQLNIKFQHTENPTNLIKILEKI